MFQKLFSLQILELKNTNRNDLVSKDLYLDDSRTRRLIAEISCFEAYRYAQLQNRELKTELVRVSRDRTKRKLE